MKLTVACKRPFNFYSVVRSHGWSILAPFQWNAETGELRRVERLMSGRVIDLTMRDAPGGILVTAPQRLEARERAELADKVARMFSLDLDLREFYRAAANEPRLAHVKRDAHGRFLRSASVWEDVVKVMMTTNIQWSGTKRLVRVLVDTFGDARENGQETLHAFPQADDIARTRESRLRKLGLGYRAPYLLQLARGVAGGRYDLDALEDKGRATEEVRRELLALPGIGPYAAATILMILGRYEHLGVDTEALRSVSRGFFKGKRIGEKEVRQTFSHWGKFQALAYWFWDWEAQFAEAER
jgi:3-methyladenine DNA glycosylase/8-oxoguanine DNA glycosylase